MEREYDVLRRELLKVGYVWEGTVLRRFLPCGKKGCSCRKSPKQRHGPYYYWTKKVGGKTISKLVSKDEGRIYMSWVGNRQRMRKTLKRMVLVTEKMAPLMLRRDVA